jgi:hypothetical protein
MIPVVGAIADHDISPVKLHILLSEAETKGYDDVVSWLPGGRSFKVRDKERFAREVLPSYFGLLTKYRSFQKNLNMWHFHAVRGGPGKGGGHVLTLVSEEILSFYVIGWHVRALPRTMRGKAKDNAPPPPRTRRKLIWKLVHGHLEEVRRSSHHGNTKEEAYNPSPPVSGSPLEANDYDHTSSRTSDTILELERLCCRQLQRPLGVFHSRWPLSDQGAPADEEDDRRSSVLLAPIISTMNSSSFSGSSGDIIKDTEVLYRLLLEKLQRGRERVMGDDQQESPVVLSMVEETKKLRLEDIRPTSSTIPIVAYLNNYLYRGGVASLINETDNFLLHGAFFGRTACFGRYPHQFWRPNGNISP